MISLQGNYIQLLRKQATINHWETWFQTPVGLFTELDLAIKRMQELDLDPELIIRPVAVAVSSDGYYEVCSR